MDNHWAEPYSEFKIYFKNTNSPTDSIGSDNSSGSETTIRKGKGKA